MSKVYVLKTVENDGFNEYITEITGVVTNPFVAQKFRSMSTIKSGKYYEELTLDDPELLNRIAKESEMKK